MYIYITYEPNNTQGQDRTTFDIPLGSLNTFSQKSNKIIAKYNQTCEFNIVYSDKKKTIGVKLLAISCYW